MKKLRGSVLVMALCLTAAVMAAAGCSKTAASKPGVAKNETTKKNAESIQGIWRIVAVEVAGEKVPDKDIKESPGTFAFTGDKLMQKIPGKMEEASTYKLDATKNPKTITLAAKMEKRELINGKMEDSTMDVTTLGIYELAGDRLKICLNMPLIGPKDRPNEFKTSKESPRMLFTLEREKK